MPFTHRGLGWFPDAQDDRDHILAAGHLLDRATTPWVADCSHLLPPVLDQGGENSCVAQAVATLLFAAHTRSSQPGIAELLSRKALWWLCRHERGLQDWNVGTYMRTAFRLLNSLGFCRERHWLHSQPHDKRPAVNAQRLSIDQRDRGTGRVIYERLNGDGPALLEGIKRAVAAGLPVVIGVDVSDTFARGDFDADASVGPPRDSDVVGGHALVVCGYDGDSFRVRNSWGEDWADGGMAWLRDDYAATGRDCWTVAAAPPYSDEAP